MLMTTHLKIAKSTFENIDDAQKSYISEKNFIYGNIKPDIVSKYKLKKHYIEESFGMIMEKIEHLCSLTLEKLTKLFSTSRFSQELGVICHFLTDFFCIAHNERWEFKHSMNKHITYERELGSLSKEVNFNKFDSIEIKNSFENFFATLYDEYKKNKNHFNDLKYSTQICKSVVDFVLVSIMNNEHIYSDSKIIVASV